MDGGMLDLYPSPADLRKQQVADIQAKRQEKVRLECTVLHVAACPAVGMLCLCDCTQVWPHLLCRIITSERLHRES